MEENIAHLQGAYEQVADRLNGVESRLEGFRAEMHAEIGGLRTEVRGDIGELRRDSNLRFAWLMGMVMTSWVTTILAILLHH